MPFFAHEPVLLLLATPTDTIRFHALLGPAGGALLLQVVVVVRGGGDDLGVDLDVAQSFPALSPAAQALSVELEGLEPNLRYGRVLALEQKKQQQRI